ncbi:uncharacterized protein LOC125830665 [Solanum verrucosum]|uniref:uncharacterized protein LOC125830665 n=1 Tax=Solanum verrucosum TaxID=315347 RepID=UPI0020D1507C|nr:uncharacterized protein LOC125830665 [Solanum verrucosum]
MQEEQQWSNPVGKSAKKVAQQNLQEVGTSNGFETLQYYGQVGRNKAVTEPLVSMGDFNSILHGDDRFGGNAVMDGEVQDFKKFMETASMIGMRCLGRRYTWTNGHIHRKIDWILTNATWVHKWEHIQGLIMEPLFSDHCAEGMEGYDISYNERCMAELEEGLMSDPLAASRQAMDEKQCKVELERWINIEESILMQKSRVQWLKLGDANTLYFHACLKSRQSQKQITQLMSLEGIVLSSGSQVEGEITKFYKQLLGSAATSLPVVDITVQLLVIYGVIYYNGRALQDRIKGG